MKIFFIILLIVFCLELKSLSHEIVGEITPLMNQMKETMALLETGKDDQAFIYVKKIYDSNSPGEDGFYNSLNRLDKEFGMNLNNMLGNSIYKKDPVKLRKTLQIATVLFMLEKFNLLQDSANITTLHLDAQREIYWSGRNFFSLLLEPTLMKYDPVEGTRMDRLLNRMLYSLEDGKLNKFQDTEIELLERIEKYFKLSFPASIINIKSRK